MNNYLDHAVLERIHPTAPPADGTSSASQPQPDSLSISLNGSLLLRVSATGVVEGELENMGIAAAVFVKEIRKQIDFPARARERIEELTDHNTRLTLENRVLRDRLSSASKNPPKG